MRQFLIRVWQLLRAGWLTLGVSLAMLLAETTIPCGAEAMRPDRGALDATVVAAGA